MIRTLKKTLILTCLLCPLTVYAAERDKLVIGVIPEINLVKQMERFVPLADYLDKKTGMNIEIKPLSNYGKIYEYLRDGIIDGGFFGSLSYAITHERLGIIPLARPVQPNGKSTYTGITFVLKKTGIKNPADMKGKTIALADPSTTAGYLAQKEYFANHGINIDKDLTILWTGSHEEAILAVLNEQAEIGGSKNTVVAKFRKVNRSFDANLNIIHENPKKGVPDNTLAVRKEIATTKRDLLQKALLDMHSDPEGKKVLTKFGAIKFIKTKDADFKALYDMTKHLKIDLNNYPYRK